VPEVANAGMIRPPLVYLGAIGLGLLLHAALPVELGVGAPAGVVAVLIAIGLLVFAVRTLRNAGTPVPGDRPTNAIVRTGPFRYSRNPIYLAFSLLQLGVAGLVNSVWLVATLVPAVMLMSFVVIPREERYLAARFPAEYSSYRSAVRRWL
jgi:protein-S-isoprenylcysteine O-methyltransferase Ste14